MKTLPALLVSLVTSSLAASQNYIIPIYGHSLAGATAGWNSIVLVSNPGDQIAHASIVQIMPMLLGPCETRPCGSQPFVVPAKSTQVCCSVETASDEVHAGAFVLSSDQPLTVETWLVSNPFDRSQPVLYQPVPVLSQWIPGGVETWIPRAISGFGNESINLFVVNPNDRPLVVEFTRASPITEPWAIPFVVPPNSTALRRLDWVDYQQGASGAGLPLYFRCSDQCMVLTSNGSLTRVPVIAR